MDKEDIKWFVSLLVNAILVLWAAFRTPNKVININKYYYSKPKKSPAIVNADQSKNDKQGLAGG